MSLESLFLGKNKIEKLQVCKQQTNNVCKHCLHFLGIGQVDKFESTKYPGQLQFVLNIAKCAKNSHKL